ncbi:hypothetical protein FRC12_006864 [Ceratobasidium sp. 428]|nr:hypothetical protein FRC12_006864 [Ceratobasidium sp. 428]
MISFIMSQHERMFEFSFFKPNNQQVLNVRESVTRRLHSSDTVRWIMFLGSKIFESILDGTSAGKMDGFLRWIAKFDEQLNRALEQSITLSDSDLVGILEITFLKLKFADAQNAYEYIRNVAPTFLQLIFADSSLWPNPYAFKVSLAHVLASPRYEFGHFVFLDSLCSLAYALPQVVEYDTSVPPLRDDIRPIEWAHGCPIDLHIALININTRCHEPNQACPKTDWRPIEHYLISWQPTTRVLPGEESWRTVARLAVQESWRHTLLIYFYMGVHGVKSGDSRVQTSVRQLFQLINVCKDSEKPMIHMYFLAQYIVAGICARTEKQRVVIRGYLEETCNHELWILKASDFVPVLDHLWHGAAANGQPVRWSDYAYSRQVALPIDV